ncbi:hypothetical protein T439DRAFT_329440 [Meredithblackwellia eburnea MCA 4105]
MSSRGSKGKGKQSGNGAGKGGGKYSANYFSRRPIQGPGIFVTCIRGKEGRCVGEMYDLLDLTAERIYPKERLEELEKTRINKPEPEESQEDEEEDKEEGLSMTEEEQAPPPVDEEDDEDESIEAQIARELKEMKELQAGSQKKEKRQQNRQLNSNGKPLARVKRVKPRFESLETHTECVVFISIQWPYDPVELTHAIVKDVIETGVARTRFTRRLEPVSLTCGALSESAIPRLSRELAEKTFRGWAEEHNTTSVTYAIETSIRSHTFLTRDGLIATLGTVVRSLSATSSESPDIQPLTVTANLTKPDLVLLPTVLKNCFSLSIVDGSLWAGKKGRKFNLDAIAEEWRRTKEAEEQALEGEREMKVE